MDLRSPRLVIFTKPKIESLPTSTYRNTMTWTAKNSSMCILNLNTFDNLSYTIILQEVLISTSVICNICARNFNNAVKVYMMTNNALFSYMELSMKTTLV